MVTYDPRQALMNACRNKPDVEVLSGEVWTPAQLLKYAPIEECGAVKFWVHIYAAGVGGWVAEDRIRFPL